MADSTSKPLLVSNHNVKSLMNRTYKHEPRHHEQLNLQVDELEVLEEVGRVELVFVGDERMEVGDQKHEDQEDTSHDPEGDFLTRIPCEDGAAEIHGHDEKGRTAHQNDCSDPVDHLEL